MNACNEWWQALQTLRQRLARCGARPRRCCGGLGGSASLAAVHGHGLLSALGFAGLWLSAGLAHAEAPVGDVKITLTDLRDSCLTERTLRARVAHYFTHAGPQQAIQVRVQRVEEGLEFAVWRAGAVMARRRFDQLPNVCVDRRDTLALAIALAIEQVAGLDAAAQRHAIADGVAGKESRPVATGDGATNSLSDADVTGTRSRVSVSADPEAVPTPKPSRQPIVQPMAEPQAAQPIAAARPRSQRAPQPRTSLARPAEVSSPVQSHTRADELSTDDGSNQEREVAGGLALEPTRPNGTTLHAGARWLAEVLPVTAYAFAAGVELALTGPLRVQFTGLASTAERPRLAGGQARMQLFGMEALGCGRIPLSFLAADGCAGLAGAGVTIHLEGYESQRRTAAFWLAGVLRVALRCPIASQAALQFAAAGLFNLVRPGLKVDASPPQADEVSHLLGGSLGVDLILGIQ